MSKKKKQDIDYRIVLGAIAAIAVVEVYALSQGVNGVILTGAIAIIAGLAGWTALDKPKFSR